VIFETLDGHETEDLLKVNSDDLKLFMRMLPNESITIHLRGDGVVSDLIGIVEPKTSTFNSIEGLKTTF
jgi:hypothetical protein